MVDVKTCKKCGSQKPLSEFSKGQYGGLQARCKDCLNKQQREYRKANPEIYKAAQRRYKDKHREHTRIKNAEYREKYPELQRKTYYQREYGITISDFDDMYIEQGGCCAICGKHQSELNLRLNIDHCHKTGKIRGLLCGNCNTSLGLLKENIGVLNNAIKYLKRSMS